MRWDARGTIALLVSAFVGVTAGVVVGFTTGTPAGTKADPQDPTSSPSASGTPDDPLRLGVPLVNLDCTTDNILVVGWGNTSGALVNAVASNQDAEVKYLEVDESCNTLYGAEKQAPPKYAVYLGPFDTTSEPCALRMSIDHSRDVVTTLKRGVRIHVQCLCSVKPGGHAGAEHRDGRRHP